MIIFPFEKSTKKLGRKKTLKPAETAKKAIKRLGPFARQGMEFYDSGELSYYCPETCRAIPAGRQLAVLTRTVTSTCWPAELLPPPWRNPRERNNELRPES
ncbi:MAG: hypothetical protein ABSG67_05605 [Thermoguttaceae bacterium]|jgi:hypothetical protein